MDPAEPEGQLSTGQGRFSRDKIISTSSPGIMRHPLPYIEEKIHPFSMREKVAEGG